MHILHIYAYFDLSGLFLMFLGSIPTTSKKNKDPSWRLVYKYLIYYLKLHQLIDTKDH